MPSSLLSLLPLAVLFPGIYVALYVAALAHEGGHAVAGALCGYRITSLGMGTARPLFVWRLPRSGTRIYICRTAPLQGLTWAYEPRDAPTKARSVCFVMGGVAVNGALALLALLPWHGLPHTPLDPASLARFVFGMANALLAVTNLFPFFLAIEGRDVLRSDGAQVVGLFLTRGRETAHSTRAVLGFRPLWEAIGDTEMQAAQLLQAASVAANLGDDATAQRYLSEAFALPVVAEAGGIPYFRAMACLTAMNVAVGAGDINRALEWLEPSDAAFAEAGNTAGQAQVALVREELHARQASLAGDLPGALQRLDHLCSKPPASPLRTMRLAGLRVRFLAHADADGLGAALARFENARRLMRSDTTDTEVFAAVARSLARRGDVAGAVAQGYEPALAAAQAVYQALADAPDEQRGYGERQAGFVTEAQEALRALGRENDADALAATAFPDPAIAEREKAEVEEKAEAKRVVKAAANNRRLRTGVIITAFNAAGGLLAYAVSQAAPELSRTNRLADALLSALLVAAIIHVTLAVIIGGALFLNRVILPNRDDATADGWIVLLLAASAYVTFVLVFVLALGK